MVNIRSDGLLRMGSRAGAIWYRNTKRPGSGAAKAPIVYVGDSGWVLSTIGHYLSLNLDDRYDFWPYWLWRGVRRSLVHFGSPPAYFGRRLYREIHRSNKQVVSWTHGQRSDPDPEFSRRLDALEECCLYVDKIVCHSRTGIETLAAEGVDRQLLEHVPHGIDNEAFRLPNESERDSARRILGVPDGALCVGSFQKDGIGMDEGLQPKWIKGPDSFLAVVDALRRDYVLFVLLTGPARGYVMAGLERLGVPYKHVHVPTYTDIVNCYWALDVYAICSRDEGGPMALLESMATGVPVVATRVGMCRDLVESGTNGLLADVDDVPSLAAGVARVFEEDELRASLASEGKATARLFDWRRIASQYDRAVYRPLMVEAGYHVG